jgi:pilus assembly protein CpaE
MKIVVLSPSEKHLQEIAAFVQERGHVAIAVAGGKTQLRSVVERHNPDVVVTDGMCCDPQELVHVEQVTSKFPKLSVVLMCPTHTPEYLLHAMRAGVREVLSSPATNDALSAAIDRIAAKLGNSESAAGSEGQVLSFMPCKGGSGATFVSTNLAWELAQEKRVLLIDLNLQFGDALSVLHDGRASTTVADVASSIDRLDASLLAASAVKISSGLSVLAAPEDPALALDVQPEHVDAILAVATQHYDFVVLDLPRAVNTLSIRAWDASTRVFPVLVPELPAIRHASRLRQIFLSLGYAPKKVQYILNGCEATAELGLDHVRRSLSGAPVFAIGHARKDISASINRGEPLVQHARSSAITKQIIALARELAPQADGQKGLFDRIFRRA